MRSISTTSEDVDLSSDPNTEAEIDAKATSCYITLTDIERNLQVENTITPDDPAIQSTRQKCCQYFLFVLYIVAMLGFFTLALCLMNGTTGNGLNPKSANILSLSLPVITALLLYLSIALMIRRWYRQNPTQTIRGYSIVLGMWVAAIVGCFIGLYSSYIAILSIGQPLSLLLGVPSSLLACFILACRRKTLLIQNMPPWFDPIQLEIARIVAPFFFLILFFSENTQPTVRIVESDLFIGTVLWQFLFLTTSTMTWLNLLTSIKIDLFLACLATILLWPFLMHHLYQKSVSFVDWLVVTRGQHQMVRMLVPNFEIINHTEDVISNENEII